MQDLPGGANTKRAGWTYYLAKFFWKLHAVSGKIGLIIGWRIPHPWGWRLFSRKSRIRPCFVLCLKKTYHADISCIMDFNQYILNVRLAWFCRCYWLSHFILWNMQKIEIKGKRKNKFKISEQTQVSRFDTQFRIGCSRFVKASWNKLLRSREKFSLNKHLVESQILQGRGSIPTIFIYLRLRLR